MQHIRAVFILCAIQRYGKTKEVKSILFTVDISIKFKNLFFCFFRISVWSVFSEQINNVA